MGGVFLIAIALAIVVLGEFLRRGSRIAAALLLGAFCLQSWDAAPYFPRPVLMEVLVGGALAIGVWGTFELAAARRKAGARR